MTKQEDNDAGPIQDQSNDTTPNGDTSPNAVTDSNEEKQQILQDGIEKDTETLGTKQGNETITHENTKGPPKSVKRESGSRAKKVERLTNTETEDRIKHKIKLTSGNGHGRIISEKTPIISEITSIARAEETNLIVMTEAGVSRNIYPLL